LGASPPLTGEAVALATVVEIVLGDGAGGAAVVSLDVGDDPQVQGN